MTQGGSDADGRDPDIALEPAAQAALERDLMKLMDQFNRSGGGSMVVPSEYLEIVITRGADNIGTYNKSAHSYRKWCRTCGGHLFTGHPGLGLTDVYAAVIPDFPYEAGIHVHYQETKLHIKDGLPKMKDVPKEMGGSGVSLAE